MTTPQPAPAPRFTMPTYQQLLRESAARRNPFGRPTELAIREEMEKSGCNRQEAIDFILERD